VTEIPAPPKVLKPQEFGISEKACTQARPCSHTFSVLAQRLYRVGSRARGVRKHGTTAPNDCQEESNRSSAELINSIPL